MTLAVDKSSDISTGIDDLSNCGAYTIEVLYADGSVLTGDPFTYEEATDTLSIETSDTTKIGTHNLTVRAFKTLYP